MKKWINQLNIYIEHKIVYFRYIHNRVSLHKSLSVCFETGVLFAYNYT